MGNIYNTWKDRKQDIFLAFSVNLFFAFTLILFGPFEIFISNTNDFSFTLSDFGWMLLLAALIFILLMTVVSMLFHGILYKLIVLLPFSFTLCCYVQTMFLNGKMQALGNGSVEFSSSVKMINLVIWIFLAAVVFIFAFLKDKLWNKAVKYISLALTAVQVVALISLLLTTNALTEEKNGYLSSKGMFELSKQDNVVVFIVDFFDGRTMQSMLAEDETLLEPLKGFTYFPNATSVHSRTYPSVPYLLTQNMCYFDKEPIEYINESYEQSDFFQGMVKNGTNIGLYTYDQYIGNSVKDKIYNFVTDNMKLDAIKTVKSMAKIVLYRDMPYVAKNRFLYDIDDINMDVVKEDASVTDEKYPVFNDEWVESHVLANDFTLTEEKSSFRFYHLGSCHLDLDHPEVPGKRSLEIIYAYLDKLNQAGLYEDTTVIITADHGNSGAGDTLDLPQKTAVPLIIVKPKGKGMSDAIVVSEAPVSQTEFAQTVAEGLNMPESQLGDTFFTIKETEKRERYYYYTALYSDSKGEVELREYLVNGDARKEDSYHFTGQKWKVEKSANKVSE